MLIFLRRILNRYVSNTLSNAFLKPAIYRTTTDTQKLQVQTPYCCKFGYIIKKILKSCERISNLSK